jgi:hypothetical protein
MAAQTFMAFLSSFASALATSTLHHRSEWLCAQQIRGYSGKALDSIERQLRI